MKILLTGAFGNVGTSTLTELVKRDHTIRCFDIPTKQNKRTAKRFRKYQPKLEFFWGDLTNLKDVEEAVQDIDIIIHLAAIIPPLANERPDIAEPVNVGGTKNILNAMKQLENPPKLIFSSSVAIYGDVIHKGFDYIIKTTDEFNPSPHDHYACHKITCERMIRESGLTWTIFRFAAIPPMDSSPDPIMFDVPLNTPIESCHTLDTGLAMANAAESTEIWGKTLHIGGGQNNRVPYRDYVGRILESIGIGRLPDEAFGKEPFHCGYMDTEESQRLLQYQRNSFDDFLEGIQKHYRFLRPLIILCRPAIRKFLLNKSKYYKAYTKSIKEYMQSKKRIIRKKKTPTPNADSVQSKNGNTTSSKTGN